MYVLIDWIFKRLHAKKVSTHLSESRKTPDRSFMLGNFGGFSLFFFFFAFLKYLLVVVTQYFSVLVFMKAEKPLQGADLFSWRAESMCWVH